MKRVCVVLVTAPSMKEAKKISQALLKKKLAACVNIVPKIFSSYWWKGKIETESETLLMIKTLSSRLPNLIQEVKKAHSYDVPEVIAFPITEGNLDYLRWIEQNV